MVTASIHTAWWRKTRLAVLVRDEGVCHLCGRSGADSVDHVLPRSRGGTNALTNLRAAHLTCNKRKFNNVHNTSKPVTSRSW